MLPRAQIVEPRSKCMTTQLGSHSPAGTRSISDESRRGVGDANSTFSVCLSTVIKDPQTNVLT
jgi:hypothetical protein